VGSSPAVAPRVAPVCRRSARHPARSRHFPDMEEPSPPADEPKPGRVGRITRSREFREVIQRGRGRVGTRMLLYVLPGEGPARAGFVTGRGVGGAVARNRARRILKEAWRTMSPAVNAGIRVVFVARPEIEGARTAELAEEMRTLLAQAAPSGERS